MSKTEDAAKVIEKLSEAVEQNMEDLPRSDVELAVVNNEYRQPWEQQVGESDLNFKYFLNYRDLGLGREIAATVVHYKPDIKYPENSFMYKLSRTQNWKTRVLAWDDDQERQYQLARSQAIRDMVDRHEGQIETAIDALMVPIDALAIAISDDPDFMKNLSKADAKKLIQMSNQSARTIPALMSAERLARGMPTEIVGGTIDHKHTVEMERDQIGEILEVLAGTGVLDAGGPGLGVGEIVEAEVVDVYPVSADDHAVSGDDG